MTQTVIVILIVTIAVAFAIRTLVRTLKGKRGCSCDCNCCDKCQLKDCDKKTTQKSRQHGLDTDLTRR